MRVREIGILLYTYRLRVFFVKKKNKTKQKNIDTNSPVYFPVK